eukprot:283137-Prorocentrum_minimum.AAC.1
MAAALVYSQDGRGPLVGRGIFLVYSWYIPHRRRPSERRCPSDRSCSAMAAAASHVSPPAGFGKTRRLMSSSPTCGTGGAGGGQEGVRRGTNGQV